MGNYDLRPGFVAVTVRFASTHGALAYASPGALAAHRASFRNGVVAAAAAAAAAAIRHRRGGRNHRKQVSKL